MYRDKTYLRTRNGMLFNVTGYRHPQNHVYASLKYIEGEKWTQGYAAAKAFLADKHPPFVDRYIRVPLEQIREVFHPQVRWVQLHRLASISQLHRLALELGDQLREILLIPESTSGTEDTEFGITDSLLWGDGHANSDIDLVVIGLENARRILQRGTKIYEAPSFTRPDPCRMTAPYGTDIPEWPRLLGQKCHMGCYRGRLFSLRCVRSYDELTAQPVELPSRFIDDPRPADEIRDIEFEIDDASESLCFPAVYRDQIGNELVDYSVVYEGVFRKGDVVRCQCVCEEFQFLNATQATKRYIVRGKMRVRSLAS